MAITIRPSAGYRLQRADKVELSVEILAAAKQSLADNSPMEIIFTTEKEAKATQNRLRTFLNSQGQGLNSKVVSELGPNDEDEWVLEFQVTPTKRDTSKLSERPLA